MIAASSLGPTLETPRLILRPPIKADFDAFAAFSADAVVTVHIGGVMSRPIAWRAFRSMAGAWALDGFSMFAVLHKATGEWMGRIGPLYPEGWPAREVGWGLARKWWGQGYGIEASAACMDFVFDVLGWDDVIHTIAPDNAGSQGVARKLGSVNRGPGKLPDPYADHVTDIWGQTRDDWQINRKALQI
ncbi:MAG: GNAT family N-acetyltransferase [Asticcacaulis sp.]|nr:GNAT family N-acetyltransferase [Asticcacaulis sp.]